MDYEYIEKDHEILEYNICLLPNYDYSDTILEEYLRKDIEEDKEMCEKLEISSPLEIDYFKFDFNADGLEDYLVCYHGYLWGGSGGNTVRIYIQETDNTLKNVLNITLRLYEPSQPNDHVAVAVLNEMDEGYYAIVLPGSNRILRFNKEKDEYVFQKYE